jgi:hypothetical protein
MDLAQIQILIVLNHLNKEFEFRPSNPNPSRISKAQILEIAWDTALRKTSRLAFKRNFCI